MGTYLGEIKTVIDSLPSINSPIMSIYLVRYVLMGHWREYETAQSWL